MPRPLFPIIPGQPPTAMDRAAEAVSNKPSHERKGLFLKRGVVTNNTTTTASAPASTQSGAVFGGNATSLQGTLISADPPSNASVLYYNSTNGDWEPLLFTSLPVFVASGTSHAPGLVPDPGVAAGTTKYLCESGGFVDPLTGGITTTVALAKLTAGGTNGSMTVTKGLITAYVAPT